MADPTAEVLKGWLESRVRYGRADESKQGMLDDELRDFMGIFFQSIGVCRTGRVLSYHVPLLLQQYKSG